MSAGDGNPRVVWSVELHQKFVQAVNQLGIDKAVPKKILESMNVPGLTRQNVASHLMKYRFHLKRLSGVSPHLNNLSNGHMQGNLQGNLQENFQTNPSLMHMARSQSQSWGQMLNESSSSHVSALTSPMGRLALTDGIPGGVSGRSGLPENGRGSGQTSFNSGSQPNSSQSNLEIGSSVLSHPGF